VASRARLSDPQEDPAAQIAWEKKFGCPDCDSSEPVPGDEARAYPGCGADIVMRCVNCESASGMTLLLSPEKSKALGLDHAIQDGSEVP
jgi:hypothetical protein